MITYHIYKDCMFHGKTWDIQQLITRLHNEGYTVQEVETLQGEIIRLDTGKDIYTIFEGYKGNTIKLHKKKDGTNNMNTVEKVEVMNIEKRYDKGYMEIFEEAHHDNTTLYELVYDSSTVAIIIEDINEHGNNVYTVRGYKNGGTIFSENLYINPSEDELLNAIDEILDILDVERAENEHTATLEDTGNNLQGTQSKRLINGYNVVKIDDTTYKATNEEHSITFHSEAMQGRNYIKILKLENLKSGKTYTAWRYFFKYISVISAISGEMYVNIYKEGKTF